MKWRYSPTWPVLVWMALAAQVALIWWHPHQPLVDWPNHMARHFLEYKALLGETLEGYRVKLTPTPNLGSDLVVPWLLLVVCPEWASATFLTLAVLAYWSGTVAFIRSAFGAAARPPALAAALLLPWLLYGAFFWGFLNFYSGVGLALLAAASAINHASYGRRSRTWLFKQALLVLLLSVWHMTAILGYIVLIACHAAISVPDSERFKRRSMVAWLRTMLPIVVSTLPGICLIVWMVVLRQDSAVGGVFRMSEPRRKVELLIGFFSGYNHVCDCIAVVAWLGAIVLGFRVESLYRKPLHWTHLSCAVFVLLYFVMPYELGSTSGVDVRMLPFAFVCGLAALARLPPRRADVAWLPLAVALIVRLTSVSIAWSQISKDLDAHLKALAALPRGARLLVERVGTVTKMQPSYHLPGWGTIRGGLTVSSLFAIPGQQPLVCLLAAQEHDWLRTQHDGTYRIQTERNRGADFFDYLWVYNPLVLSGVSNGSWERIYHHHEIDIWRRRN